MTFRYEINPPKINLSSNLSEDEIKNSLSIVEQRVSQIGPNCDGIHLTDSVLGIPRISPITAGTLIRMSNQEIEITVSLRVIDKELSTLEKLMSTAVTGGLNGVLVLKGDPAQNEVKDSGLIPSQTLKYFNDIGFGKKIDMYLSLPSNPNFDKIKNKIEAEPTGFVTQVIHSIDEVSRIVDKLKPLGFRIIPCILLPSEKNAKSAKFLNLDWSGYKDSAVDFIKQVNQIAGEVLITSPNDFKGAQETLKKLAI